MLHGWVPRTIGHSHACPNFKVRWFGNAIRELLISHVHMDKTFQFSFLICKIEMLAQAWDKRKNERGKVQRGRKGREMGRWGEGVRKKKNWH
jgi:hypothetical protein